MSTEALDRYLCPTYSPTEEFEEFLKDYVTLKGRITDIRREKYVPPVAVFPGRNEDYEVVCELLDPSELKRYAPGDTITFVGLYDRRQEHQLRLRYCKILDADF